MITSVTGDFECPSWSLTPDQIRSFEGLESLTNDQAEKIIESLVRLAVIAYNAD